MRALHLIQRYAPGIGGAERWAEGVARHLAARGHTLEILTLAVTEEADVWGGPVPPERTTAVGGIDLYPGICVRRFPASAAPAGLLRLATRCGIDLGGPFSAPLFRRAVRAARRADVVHLHHCTGALSFWGLGAARLARRPAVITPYSHPGDAHFEQRAVGWLLRRCDAVVALTPWEADLLVGRGVAPERVVTSTSAVDLDSPDDASHADLRERVRALWGLGVGTRVVTFLGRKSPDKAIPVLVEAAARVARTIDLALVLLGPPMTGYDARAGASAAGLRVIDLPAVPEPAKHAALAASDVLVQPSVREAFGIVFLDAWASGIPVVGANHGAIPAVVGDGGLTFAPGDAGDLAARLSWLLSHPLEARAMARRGRERVARDHTWQRVGHAVEEAYAIARGAAARPIAPS